MSLQNRLYLSTIDPQAADLARQYSVGLELADFCYPPTLEDDAVRAAVITAGMPRVHGAPVHMGDPAAIGITDLAKPDFGDAVTVKAGEIPVFWPCGVTPQAAVMAAKPSFAITHAPGHMFITDVRNSMLKN